MNWNEIFEADHIPSHEEIRDYLGEAKSHWDVLTAYIEETYLVKPQIAYSKCTAQPGWNMKYKKSNKSLCTLYPMAGYFIALVVIGSKEDEEVKIAMNSELFTPYIKELYNNSTYSGIGRWLMIKVNDKSVLYDIKSLLTIKVRPKTINY